MMGMPLAFLLALVIPAARANDAAVLQLKPVVQVSGANSSVTIGELLNTHGLTADDLGEVTTLTLTDTPKAGEVRSFSNHQIEDLVREPVKRMEERKGQKITLRIPLRITVSRRVMALTSDAIETEMKAQLKTICAECKFEISNLKLPIVSDATSVSWSLRLRSEIPKGGFSIPLTVKTEKGDRSYWVSGQLNTFKSVPVLSRAVEIGEKLRAEDFIMEEKDVTFANDQAASAPEIAASVTARQIAAGQILWRNALKREVAVKQGESVKVVSGGESEDAVWQISIDGVAQSAGYIGEVVKVKIPKTQKLVSGLLKEKGLVEVR